MSANVTPLVTRSGDQRTLRVGQLGLALSLFLAPWFIVLANTGDSLMTMDRGDGMTPGSALALAAAHPELERWSNFAALLGSLLMVPASLGLMGLALRRSRAVPAWAAYAVLGWPILHVLGAPWFEVVGAVSQGIGMAMAALALWGGIDAEAHTRRTVD